MTVQYVRKASLETVELDGESIILNTELYTVTKLNGLGGFCWALLDKIQTVKTLVAAISESFEAVDESVEQDVEHFLAELTRCGLIEYAV